MKKSFLLNSVTSCFPAMAAFDNEGGKWKLDEKGAMVLKDGNPVYLNNAGEEQTVDNTTIARLNAEAATNRKRAETAEAKILTYGDIDPTKALAALDMVSKIDEKTLIDAGEVDKVRAEISKQYEGQIIELTTDRDGLQGRVQSMTMDSAFAGSVYVKENIAVPGEMFRNTFGKHFKVEDGKVNAYGADGNRLMSKKSIGAYADFDEASEILVDAYAFKDSILKPVDQRGSGNGGGGGGRGGGATMSTAAFDQLPPNQQAEAAAKAGKGELTIVDAA